MFGFSEYIIFRCLNIREDDFHYNAYKELLRINNKECSIYQHVDYFFSFSEISNALGILNFLSSDLRKNSETVNMHHI